MDAEKIIAWLLRFAGAFLLLAWPTMFLPVSWQAAAHQALGLGDFPASPLVDYLTRSIAVLYGSRGLVYLLLAGDVLRYAPLIRLFAVLDIVAGVALLAIGFHAGLPSMWVLVEGPSLIAFGAVLLLLLRKVADASQTGPASPV